jgi:hypothetical protein
MIGKQDIHPGLDGESYLVRHPFGDDLIKVRALFLDFDGVLHAVHGRPEVMREFVWLPILLKLLEPHQDMQLVVHASARRTSHAEFIGKRLEHRSAGFAQLYAGVTPPRLDRWASIQAWLAEHPEIGSFRILDDQAGEFPSPPPAELILCNPTQGLSAPGVQAELARFLAGASSPD